MKDIIEQLETERQELSHTLSCLFELLSRDDKMNGLELGWKWQLDVNCYHIAEWLLENGNQGVGSPFEYDLKQYVADNKEWYEGLKTGVSGWDKNEKQKEVK